MKQVDIVVPCYNEDVYKRQGLNDTPKLGMTQVMVGERSVRGEVVAKAAVDFTEVRMPE